MPMLSIWNFLKKYMKEDLVSMKTLSVRSRGKSKNTTQESRKRSSQCQTRKMHHPFSPQKEIQSQQLMWMNSLYTIKGKVSSEKIQLFTATAAKNLEINHCRNLKNTFS